MELVLPADSPALSFNPIDRGVNMSASSEFVHQTSQTDIYEKEKEAAPLSLLYEAEQRLIAERNLQSHHHQIEFSFVATTEPCVVTESRPFEPESESHAVEEAREVVRRSARKRTIYSGGESYGDEENESEGKKNRSQTNVQRRRRPAPILNLDSTMTDSFDEKLSGIAPIDFRSALSGVYFHLPKKEWRAVIGRGNRRQQKTFSVRKYGFFSAKEQAEYFRHQFDSTGYVFDSRRGTSTEAPPISTSTSPSLSLYNDASHKSISDANEIPKEDVAEQEVDTNIRINYENSHKTLELNNNNNNNIILNQQSLSPPIVEQSFPEYHRPPVVMQLIDYEEVAPKLFLTDDNMLNDTALAELCADLKETVHSEEEERSEYLNAIDLISRTPSKTPSIEEINAFQHALQILVSVALRELTKYPLKEEEEDNNKFRE